MDSIFYNGVIYTGREGETVTALAVRDGRIAAVGGSELLSLAGEGTQCIDLEGSCVTPGFIDTHTHIAHMSRNLEHAALAGTASLGELVQRLRSFIEQRDLAPGQWVRGHGWNQDLFAEGTLPDRHVLDEASREHPIVAVRVCGHCAVANTAALEAMGITAATPCPPGGSFTLGPDGEPDGRFYEDAIGLIRPAAQPISRERAKAMLRQGLQTASSLGLTAVCSDDLMSLSCSWQTVMEAYRELEAEGGMPVRVREQCQMWDDALLEAFFAEGCYSGQGSDIFRLGPLKLLADGSLGARSAWLRQPYRDGEGRGIATYSRQQLDHLVLAAHRRGMPVAVHAIGDAAVEAVLDAIKAARQACPGPALRHGIVHCQITDEGLLERIAAEDVQVYAQPVFLEYDLHIVESRVGPQLAATSYAFRQLQQRGVPISAGSDCPVESINPLCGFYCAVTGQDYDGNPEGGWHPEGRFTRQQALALYTQGGAWAMQMEDRLGILAPGMLADFAVFDRDIMTCPAPELLRTGVKMTVMDGTIRYKG